ncbi:O-antigen flipase Wzx [Pseudonocardia aurantiaca]
MGGRVRWRPPRVLRGVLSIVGGSAAGQGLVILSYPFLTRLYDPAEFGLLAVFMAVVGMIGVVSAAALEAAVPLPVDDAEAAAVAWAGLTAVAVTTVVTASAGVLLAEPLAGLLGVPRLADVWWLVCLSVLVLGCYLVASEWMIRERSYGTLGRRNLLQGVGQAVTQIGLGLVGVRPIGLLLGFGVGRLLGIGGVTSRGGLLRRPPPRPAAILAALRRYRRFPLLAAPSGLLNSAGLEVPLLLVSALYGDARAGFLGLTIRVIGAPATVIGQAVHQVFTGESGARIRDADGGLGASVRSASLRLLAVGALPALTLVVTGPALFGLVFGPAWTEAGDYARLLAVAYLVQFAVTPVSSTLFLLEHQDRELGWVAVRLLLTAGGPIVCGLTGAPIGTAIFALALGHVVSYGLLYLLCVRAADAADRSGRPG